MKIKRIYPDVDMRGWDNYLQRLLENDNQFRNKLKIGECFLFISKSKKMIKLMAHEGIYSQKLTTKITPVDIENIGKYFKISPHVNNRTPVVFMKREQLKFSKVVNYMLGKNKHF